MVMWMVTHSRFLILGTFVKRLLSQWIEFELMQNFVRLLFFLIFDILAKVKPSQIDWFFLVTRRRTCRVRNTCYGIQGVHVGDPMLHIVNAEPLILSNSAFATQIACNTHIWRSLGNVLSEDVFIRWERRFILCIHRPARFEPDRLTLIFELRVKDLKRGVCVVSLSLKATICQKWEYLELISHNELSVVEVENVVMR